MSTKPILASDLSDSHLIDLEGWGLSIAPLMDGTVPRLWRVPWQSKRAINTAQKVARALGPETVRTLTDTLLAFYQAPVDPERPGPLAALAKVLPQDLGACALALADNFPEWWGDLVVPTLNGSVRVALSPDEGAITAPLLEVNAKGDAIHLLDRIFPEQSWAILHLTVVVLLEQLAPLGVRDAIRGARSKLSTSGPGPIM